MNLSSIDLNLLYLFAVVLEERSATRAARRLSVTQPAVSNGLRRLRELLGDPLFVRRPYGLEPTPRARALLPALRAWVEAGESLFDDAPTFDPRTSARTLRIACTDAVATVLLQPLLRLLAERAPDVHLRLVTLDRMLATGGLERGEVDVLIGRPAGVGEGHEAELLFQDPMACIVRADHPGVGRRMSLEAFASLPHVDLALFDGVDDAIDRALSKRGRSRTVRVALPHFSSVPLAVAASDCVATLSRRLAVTFAGQLPLRVLKPPVALEPVEIRQVWHRARAADGALSFLRQTVRDAAKRSLGRGNTKR